MKNIIWWIIAFFALLGFLWYSDMRDEQIRQSAEAYERCVALEFGGQTPSQIYAATGEYPECEE